MTKRQHTAEDWPHFEWPTQEEMLAQVLAMPPFEPGKIVSIPLHLWPTYRAVNNLKENGISPIGNLYVTRREDDHQIDHEYLVARSEVNA